MADVILLIPREHRAPRIVHQSLEPLSLRSWAVTLAVLGIVFAGCVLLWWVGFEIVLGLHHLVRLALG